MSAQNTHHIPTVFHVFGSFHTIISALIALYLILGFVFILGENGSIWKMCKGVKKYSGDPSPNVATSQYCDIRMCNVEGNQIRSPTSQRRNVAET